MLSNKQALDVHDRIVQHAYSIVKKKRHDYSGPDDPFRNFRMSEHAGCEPWRGCMVRMMDKLSRIRSIIEAGGVAKVEDERLLDTFADIVNYTCILAGLVAELGYMEVPDER